MVPFPRNPQIDLTVFRDIDANIPRPGEVGFISKDAPEPRQYVQAVTFVWMEPKWIYWMRDEGGWRRAGSLTKYPAVVSWDKVAVDNNSVRHDLRDVTLWALNLPENQSKG